VHAHLGRDAGDEQRSDAAVAQQQLEVGGVERALAGLVQDDLTGRRRERVDTEIAGKPRKLQRIALRDRIVRYSSARSTGGARTGAVGIASTWCSRRTASISSLSAARWRCASM
jgi:hypothetical protein